MKRFPILFIFVILAALELPALAEWLPPAKYATQYTLYFAIEDSNSPHRFYETAPDATDIHVFADGVSEAQAANAVTDLGRTFSLVLTAEEMTAKVVTVDVNDASEPPLFKDTVFYIPTFGHASAYHVFDYSADVPTKEEIRVEIDTNSTDLNDILTDTSAYDTDAEHAAAIWNALMATYTIELSFGGELQQLDPNVTSILANTVAIKAVTDIMQAVNSTVSVADDANSFTIADGNDVNDCFNGHTIYIQDATTGDWVSRFIENWETGRVVTVDTPFPFTPEVGDVAVIWGIGYVPPLILNQFPLPRETTHTVTDRTASIGGGGTRTLDPLGNDP